MQYDKEKKSIYIKELLGEIHILDSERELEKILSMKYKNIQKGTYSESSYNRNDEEEVSASFENPSTSLSPS